MMEEATATATINDHYDRAMYDELADEYYGHSGFHNFGYWTATTRNQREASENLVDVLLEQLPDKTGRILDVACGMGASSVRLLQHYRESDIVGLNISEKQLATCREQVPGARFLSMDATKLVFPDNSFESILCVEAAFHFDTREQFLHEAYRVLKPGGCLVLSDILTRTDLPGVPPANRVPNLAAYRLTYERCGFQPVLIAQARPQCWGGFRDHHLAFVWNKKVSGEVSWAVAKRKTRNILLYDWLYTDYLLVAATKPPAHRIRQEQQQPGGGAPQWGGGRGWGGGTRWVGGRGPQQPRGDGPRWVGGQGWQVGSGGPPSGQGRPESGGGNAYQHAQRPGGAPAGSGAPRSTTLAGRRSPPR